MHLARLLKYEAYHGKFEIYKVPLTCMSTISVKFFAKSLLLSCPPYSFSYFKPDTIFFSLACKTHIKFLIRISHMTYSFFQRLYLCIIILVLMAKIYLIFSPINILAYNSIIH